MILQFVGSNVLGFLLVAEELTRRDIKLRKLEPEGQTSNSNGCVAEPNASVKEAAKEIGDV